MTQCTRQFATFEKRLHEHIFFCYVCALTYLYEKTLITWRISYGIIWHWITKYDTTQYGMKLKFKKHGNTAKLHAHLILKSIKKFHNQNTALLWVTWAGWRHFNKCHTKINKFHIHESVKQQPSLRDQFLMCAVLVAILPFQSINNRSNLNSRRIKSDDLKLFEQIPRLVLF